MRASGHQDDAQDNFTDFFFSEIPIANKVKLINFQFSIVTLQKISFNLRLARL